MQSRSNRYYWRQRTRRLMRLINGLLTTIVLLVVLVPGLASAAPACLRGSQCVYVVRGRLAVWPVQAGAARYAVAIDPEAQP